MKKLATPVLVAAAVALLAGCGDGGARPEAQAPVTNATTTDGEVNVVGESGRGHERSAIARNAGLANRFVGDGQRGLDQRLAELKGEPVVVNMWASWCGPCRFEFPFFAAATRTHAARVAFVGLDVLDDRDSAQAFIDHEPPGFPSVYDGDGKAARSLGGGRAMPTTVYIGRDGRVAFTKLGGYAKAADLDADIRRYALGRS